ncbi:CoA transferase [Alicyclobacillus tolerans]|uniref:CaiB/BaiF CoA transferase family protein n=1 Tax=Alicyclobacillus tolerans TaxID=90970 RepID=UPI001F24C1F7|nr:CoA transferase [Alicyclobacillus tolerans]MCF8566468.1 CoA transferase [Alicyclobacillus tolerans]
MGPLSGVRVLDFTRVLAGPFCTMNLADLGAEVIKIESVHGGDETRGWGPPFISGESAYYLCVNRNKRSIAIDLKSPEGSDIVRKLMADADVVIHNFLPRSANKLGLSYDQVKQVKSDVVYCSISGFGVSENRPGYDYIMQAMGGLMSITGEEGGTPYKVGVAITDLFTGLYAVVGIQAALMERQKTGQGQSIDMALYDAQIAMLANVASNVLVGQNDAKRFGNGHPNIVPYQLFDTSDGQVVITVGNDHQFQSFCSAFGLDELPIDPRFATNPSRVAHRTQLVEILQLTLSSFDTQEVLAKVNKAGVPCGPVRSVKQALFSDETALRNMLWNVPHPDLGDLTLVGSPVKLSATPPALRMPPPRLGEHTREVLSELSYHQDKIDDLKEKGVILTC